jgi:hypothetical protein
MQVKTIKKNLVAKLEDWLGTIEDENLRKQVKDDLLVSGGSIANMFLNTDVNDYDIYMQNYSTLLELAMYYVNKENMYMTFGEKAKEWLNAVDNLENVIKYIEVLTFDDKDSLLAEFPSERCFNRKKIIIENLSDDKRLALFPIEDSSLYVAPEREYTKNDKYRVACISCNAISLTDDIQIVTRFFGTPEQIHKTFDFIHATNYFTFKDGLVLNQPALTSLLEKQLRYQGSLYPLTSILRAKKFIKRGWNIDAGEYLKILFQVSQLDLTDINVLYEQLIGVDVAYFGILVEILSGVPKEKMRSAYINDIIDRVFNEYDGEV